MTKNSNTYQQGIDYAMQVVDGEIVAGELIQLACRRFLNDLIRGDLIFDGAKVDK